MNRIITFLSLIILLSVMGQGKALADDSQAFGEWNIYNATPQPTQMQVFGDQLFVLNNTALSSIDLDLDPDTQQSYNRTVGLSGASVQYILASPDAGKLAIAYHDGNIDLMDADGHILGIPDLASKPMSGDKTIYSLRECHGTLYVSGGFGVLAIDMEQAMIVHHYPSSFPVLFAFEYEGIVYRYSERRHLEYLLPGSNGNDPSCWLRLSTDAVLRDALVLTDAQGQDHCYVITGSGELMQLSQDGLTSTQQNQDYRRLYRVNHLLMAQGNLLTLCDPARQSFTHNGYSPYKDCSDFVAADDSTCYMLHSYYGVFQTRYTNYVPNHTLGFEADYEAGAQPNGIATSYLGEMHLTGNGVVGIGRRSYVMGLGAANSLSGVISYLDTETDEVRNVIARQIMHRLPEGINFQGLQGFDIDPTNPSRYAISSSMFGLYILDHDTITHCYHSTNSEGHVEAFNPTFASTRISAVAYDREGNLFYTNSVQDTTLRCLTADGRWLKFPNAGMAQVADARRILISRHGSHELKWVLNDYGYQNSRIGIYDDGGTLTHQADDQCTYFSVLVDQDYNDYIPYYIYDLCEDLDGKVWVLTNLGPFVIEDPMATFQYAKANPGRGRVRRVKIPRNDGTNLADYLMESTPVSCMVVDNFNRKWIGTYGAGLYLMSADCITELEHFDIDNSPLLSNSILDLCYDPESGLLYISCEGGLLTYQTDAIEGADDFSHIHCFPNPVRPEFGGELRIMGLMNDSQVSITTVGGNLIYRTRSDGATATWDLRTADGSRVDPGVYLIHGIDSEGKKGQICRFLVL